LDDFVNEAFSYAKAASKPEIQAAGRVLFNRKPLSVMNSKELFYEICTTIGGRAAEARATGAQEFMRSGSDLADLQQALAAYRELESIDEEALLQRANRFTDDTLQQHWRTVDRLAYQLHDRRRIDADALKMFSYGIPHAERRIWPAVLL
jgi:hypothetical protein